MRLAGTPKCDVSSHLKSSAINTLTSQSLVADARRGDTGAAIKYRVQANTGFRVQGSWGSGFCARTPNPNVEPRTSNPDRTLNVEP
jgi:hypothetical protein